MDALAGARLSAVTKSVPEFLRRNFKMAAAIPSDISAVAPTVVGSLLGGDSKGPSVSQATSITQAPEYVRPMFEQAAAESQRLYQAGQLGQYQQLSPTELAAIQRGIGMVMSATCARGAAVAGQLLGGAAYPAPAQQVFQRLLLHLLQPLQRHFVEL